jgi:hypothetical protein
MTLEGRPVAAGKPDCNTPGAELTSALICDNKELTTPDGNTVAGRLIPPARSDTNPGPDVAPALICESKELTMPVGRAVTPGSPD